MKRDLHQGSRGGGGVKGESSSSSSMLAVSSGKGKMKEDIEELRKQDASGMDELLAVLGYKVRNSDMADVAQKLEQLEMAIAQEDGISHLSTDTVHYNPSDISGWLENMLSEFNSAVPPPPSSSSSSTCNFNEPLNQIEGTSFLSHSSITFSSPWQNSGLQSSQSQLQSQSCLFEDHSEYDLSAIPGGAIYPQRESSPESHKKDSRKRIKMMEERDIHATATATATATPTAAADSTRPVILDSQETGVRLVHALMACAEAVQQENMKLADALVKHIGMLAASQAGAMRKVATYFAEALARRIYRIYPQDTLESSSYSDMLQMHFYETCPYLKFAHFTANQAILEAFEGASRVHVIDFSLKQGMQWPALIQALALRPGGPPSFRLTGIGPPQPDDTDALQQVGWKLAQLAQTIGVEFEFHGFVANSLADLEPSMFKICPTDVEAEAEAVAVNSVFELHRLLARTGAIEKVLGLVKAMKPKIMTIVEQEANHNGPVFVDRFNEALHYYSNLFDSLEGSGLFPPTHDLVMSEMYLGHQICNVVACEGVERVERHETLTQWRTRMNSAGFEPVFLGSNAFKQASMLLALYAGGDGYRVEENSGCLMLGWHTRPLIATSAWQLAAGHQ